MNKAQRPVVSSGFRHRVPVDQAEEIGEVLKQLGPDSPDLDDMLDWLRRAAILFESQTAVASSVSRNDLGRLARLLVERVDQVSEAADGVLALSGGSDVTPTARPLSHLETLAKDVSMTLEHLRTEVLSVRLEVSRCQGETR